MSMSKLEQELLNRILYIGDEIPDGVASDPRPKFVLLGSPKELIDAVPTRPAGDSRTVSFKNCDNVEELLGQLVGAASMAWENVAGAGVFDSEWAGLLVDAARDRLIELGWLSGGNESGDDR